MAEKVKKNENDLSDLGGSEVDLSDLGGSRVEQEQVPTFEPLSILGATPVIGEALQGGAEGFIESAPAMLTGGLQGATMGFSDEIGAGGDVALDALMGRGLDVNKWRDYQKQREADNLKLKEESPWAYMGGEIAGGLATVPLMPAMGGAKLVGMAGKLSPKLAALMAKSTPEAMAIKEALQAGKLTPEAAELAIQAAPKLGAGGKIVGSAAKQAIEGAPVGAIYGVGASEHNMSDPMALAKDAASSAAMGSVAGLAIGGGAQALSSGVEALGRVGKSSDFFRKMGVASDFGGEGTIFSTREGKDQVAKLLEQYPEEVTQELLEGRKLLGERLGNSLNPEFNPSANKLINVDTILEKNADNVLKMVLDNPTLMNDLDGGSKKLLERMMYMKNLGDLPPAQVKSLIDGFKNLKQKLNNLRTESSESAKYEANQLIKQLDNVLQTEVPEYKREVLNFIQYSKGITDVLLDPETAARFRTKTLKNVKDPAKSLYHSTADVLGEAQLPGKAALSKRKGLNEVVENLKGIEESSPEVMAKLGGTSEQVGKRYLDLADKMAVLGQAQGTSPHEGFKEVVKGSLLGSGEGYAYGLANRYGAMKKAIGQSAPVQQGVKLFRAGDEQLMGIAQQMKNNKAFSLYGEGLEKALLNKDEAAKNAALFKMMQSKDMREFLRSEGYDSNE